MKMTIREYLNKATDAEFASYIMGLCEAAIEEFSGDSVPFDKRLAIFGATQDILQSEMFDDEAEDNKKVGMFMAVTAANFRMLRGSEQNDTEAKAKS